MEFHGFLWFYQFPKVSASIFWIKTVLTSNWVFSPILKFQGVSSEKIFYVQITIVSGDIDAKKDLKNFHKLCINFFHCLIVISSLLWAFMVQNLGKNSCSGGKSTKYGVPVVKISFFCKKLKKIARFYELTPKLLSVLASLILHNCGF